MAPLVGTRSSSVSRTNVCGLDCGAARLTLTLGGKVYRCRRRSIMRIGELGERAQVTVKAVRYYERLGLVEAAREPNGYRLFGISPLKTGRSSNAWSSATSTAMSA